MTQKPPRSRFRPAVESLETVMLLSTASAPAVAHHAATAQAHVQVVSAESTQVNLHGTINAKGTIHGTTATASGSGKLGSVGVASIKASVNLLSPPTSFTLSTKKGNIFLSASSSPIVTGSNSGSASYTITGGTKAYANATGSGTIMASYALNKNKVSLKIQFV